jgi:hypothetical protein
MAFIRRILDRVDRQSWIAPIMGLRRTGHVRVSV